MNHFTEGGKACSAIWFVREKHTPYYLSIHILHGLLLCCILFPPSRTFPLRLFTRELMALLTKYSPNNATFSSAIVNLSTYSDQL